MFSEDPRNPVYRAELEQQIKKMEDATSVFYVMAQQAGVHTFIEFCGFMNEYIQLCRDALKADIDFSRISTHTGGGSQLPFLHYRVNYLGEKFGCIFEPWFAANPKAVIPFFRSAGIVIPEPSAEATVE